MPFSRLSFHRILNTIKEGKAGDLPTDPRRSKANKFQTKRPISLKLPPARPKSVYLPVRRAPGSKFGCMSSRSAAFRIDSGQLRFAMMRNLTVILRDLNLGAWRPRQIDKTSLSRGRVVTFALSQTDTDVITRICFTYRCRFEYM